MIRQMSKRMIVVIVAIAMIMGAMPIVASADNGPKVYILGTKITESGDVSGITGVSGKINVSIDNDNDKVVITMENATITASGQGIDGMSFDCCDVEFMLIGENGIYLTEITNDSDAIYSNDEDKDIVFSGSGSLDVEATGNQYNYGLDLSGNCEFKDTVNISITSESDGIYCQGLLYYNLENGGKVEAKSNDKEDSVAVCVEEGQGIKFADNNEITTPVNGKLYTDVEDAYIFIADANNKAAKTAVVENKTEKTPAAKKTGADTGDTNTLVLYAGLLLLTVAAAGAVALKRN